MKRIFYISMLVFGIFILLSNTTSSTKKQIVIGSWLYPSNFSDTLTRTSNFFGNKFGFKFKKNGDFVLKSSFKWCGNQKGKGTNYFGKWAYLNDSIISVSYNNEFGTTKKECKFKILNNNKLLFDF